MNVRDLIDKIEDEEAGNYKQHALDEYELEVMWQKDNDTAIYKYIESIFEINHNTKTITLRLK